MADIGVQRVGGDTPTLVDLSGVARSVYAGYVIGDAVAATAGGDAFVNDGRTLFRVINSSAGVIEVRFLRQKPTSTGEKYDSTYSVGAGGVNKLCGPFAPSEFNDDNGKVQVRYSAVAGVSVSAFRIAGKHSA
jgi:hypothetical protein